MPLVKAAKQASGNERIVGWQSQRADSWWLKYANQPKAVEKVRIKRGLKTWENGVLARPTGLIVHTGSVPRG